MEVEIMIQNSSRRPGYVTTFYSYKGGVGRTFLLANVAWLLARWGRKVLCLDWDLEAPGLYRFLAPLAGPKEGVVYILGGVDDGKPIDWRECVEDIRGTWNGDGCLHMIGAGRGDDEYVRRVQTLNWDDLSQKGLEPYMEKVRAEWVAPGEYDHVLVDSRTGITDIGGICAAQLPDLLILTFTATFQSLEGAIDVAGRAERAREIMLLDRGGFNVLPIPCRLHFGEEEQLEREWNERFASTLAHIFEPWRTRKIEARQYVANLSVPEHARWSFGEQVPVKKEPLDDPKKVSYTFANIAALVDHRLQESGQVVSNRHAYIEHRFSRDIILPR